MNGQLVLPCCCPQDPPRGREWIAEQYPMTAEELALADRGIRLARFMNEDECRKCPYGPFSHMLGSTKVCLRDLQRLGLWKPEDEEWYRLQKKAELEASKRHYRILHRPTRGWWEGEAGSAQDACEKAGWAAGDCWVRQYTGKGWGKPREED